MNFGTLFFLCVCVTVFVAMLVHDYDRRDKNIEVEHVKINLKHSQYNRPRTLSLSLRVPICRADDRKLFRIRSDLNAINSPFSLTAKNIHKQYFAGNKLIKRSANKQTTKCGFCLDYVFGTATPACALCTEEIEFRRGQIFWEMIYWITHFVCVHIRFAHFIKIISPHFLCSKIFFYRNNEQ